jgi:hypothetical protein
MWIEYGCVLIECAVCYPHGLRSAIMTSSTGQLSINMPQTRSCLSAAHCTSVDALRGITIGNFEKLGRLMNSLNTTIAGLFEMVARPVNLL